MEILIFQIVDLGAAPDETVMPGDSFRSVYDSSVMGTGLSAKLAMSDALDQLALGGLGTRLLNESAIEDGWMSPQAEEPADQIYEEDDEEGEKDDEPLGTILYHVLIRFQHPDKE
jgi:hypothetical protein